MLGRGSTRRWGLVLAAGWLLVTALASAARGAEEDEGFVLRPASRAVLARLQNGWLDWLTAVNGSDAETASAAVDALLAHTLEVGMERLPDLAVGAAMRAVELARDGDFERAGWALEAAERLDPGRPESAFARAEIERLNGSRIGPLTARLEGYVRALALPLERRILLHNLAVWLATVLALVAVAFVALQMATKGALLYRDLVTALIRYLPTALAHAFALVALSWPILLPSGLLWLAIYWSVLLWGHGGRLERLLFVGVWLAIGGLPAAVSEQARRVEVALFGPLNTVVDAAGGRLDGNLVTDLGILRAQLPVSVAVKHLLADMQRKLGQWDNARALYREVLEAEPENVTAAIDLGTCYIQAGEFQRAIDSFQSATAARKDLQAAVQFNLSKSYSELYRFDESEAALRTARRLDSERVNAWMRSESGERAVAVDGGLERVGEIRAELRGEWRRGEAATWTTLWRRTLSLPLAIAFVLIAVGVHLASRGSGNRPAGISGHWLPGRTDLVRRVLLPGIPEAERGQWGRALGAVAPAIGLATLPVVAIIGLPVPWGLDPGSGLAWAALAVGGLLYLLLRWRGESRR